jgi:hypothetical protein
MQIFDHLADDELAILREERRNQLRGTRKRGCEWARRNDLRTEIDQISRELTAREIALRQHLAQVRRAGSVYAQDTE